MGSSNHDGVAFVLPLMPFERKLVNEAVVYLEKYRPELLVEDTSLIHEAFHCWEWSSTFFRWLQDFLGGEILETEHHGSRASAYDSCLRYLTSTNIDSGNDTLAQNTARVIFYSGHNKDFLKVLDDKPVEAIQIVPSSKDSTLWRCLSALFFSFGRNWQLPPSAFDARRGFKIHALVKMFALHSLWPNNLRDAHVSLLQDDVFLYHHEVIAPNTSESLGQLEVYRIQRKQGEEGEAKHIDVKGEGEIGDELDMELERRMRLFYENEDTRSDDSSGFPDNAEESDESTPDDTNSQDNSADDNEMIKRLLRGYAASARRPLLDPRAYVQYIPYNELASADTNALDLSVPFMKPIGPESVFLWEQPPTWRGAATDHLLHTEDEVYQYWIEHATAFPDLFSQSKVVFVLQPLHETTFAKSLHEFWQYWNDCAITRSEPDGALYLLQTIAGMRFRAWLHHQDTNAALTVFRNLTEEDFKKRQLGPVETNTRWHGDVDTVYRHSFPIIPAREVEVESFHRPLGRGQNGAVYAAKWHMPAKMLKTSDSGTMDVVLKDVFERDTARSDVFRELERAYKAMGGHNTGCVPFVGIVVFPNHLTSEIHKDDPRPEGDSRTTSKTFLVFKRASRGTAAEHLSEHLRSESYWRSWKILIDTLSSIANGILNIHKHGLVHRDLHLNNILVTDACYKHDPLHPHEVDLWISDLGESKVLAPGTDARNITDAYRSYGAIEFRAPEVSGPSGWTTAAEVFTFGIISCKLLDIRYAECNEDPPLNIVDSAVRTDVLSSGPQGAHGTRYLIPRKLQLALSFCLTYEPRKRPGMREVVSYLDEASDDFMDMSQNVKYVYWDWDDALTAGRLRARRSDPLQENSSLQSILMA